MAKQTLTQAELNNLLAACSDFIETSAEDTDTPFFELLVSTGRAQFLKMVTERRYEPGEIVCREGEQGDSLYLIWAGRVAVLKGDFASPTVVDYHGPGAMIGEMALLENRTRSASVVALDNLRLLEITQEVFQRWVDKNPSVARKISEMLSNRLRTAEKRLVGRVSRLQTEKDSLLALQRLRQDTTDFIIHDLRNPLGAIITVFRMLEMVLPEEALEANSELLSIGKSSYERMQMLVDSLLEVSRMEAGESALELSEVNLDELIGQVVQRMTVFRSKGISLEINALKDPLVKVDRDKIDRVMANLLDNAAKHTPEAGRVRVEMERQADQLLVCVSDSGPGIPPEEREHIFERFTQTKGEQHRRRGFGLGLTFCRLAVEAHGGRIWVEPGDGGLGSAFKFTIKT